MEWVTQSEFARKEGVSRMAVNQAIRAGRLRTNGKTGRACRINAECTLASTRTNIPASLKNVPNAGEEQHPSAMTGYQEARTKKLLAEIEAANYRNKQKYNEMLRQVSEKQFELFSSAFAPVKDMLINLNLSARQYEILRSAIEKAMNDFRQSVSDWNDSLK